MVVVHTGEAVDRGDAKQTPAMEVIAESGGLRCDAGLTAVMVALMLSTARCVRPAGRHRVVLKSETTKGGTGSAANVDKETERGLYKVAEEAEEWRKGEMVATVRWSSSWQWWRTALAMVGF